MPSIRTVLLAGGALAALLVVGAGAAYATSDDTVPRGVRVAGTDRAGLDAAAAERRVAQALQDVARSPVAVVAGDDVLTLQPEAAGLRLDARATAQQALEATPLDRLRALFGSGRDVDPVTAVDEPALRAALDELAEGFDRAPREGSVGFGEDAEPQPVLPEEGRALDVDGAVDAVRDRWLVDGVRVEVPVDVEEVRTTEEDVRTAVREIAEPAVAAPVVVEVDGKDLEVRPADIAAGLVVQADDDGELVPQLDAAKVLAAVGTRVRAVEQPAVDATFDTSSGTPVVVPSQDGKSLTAEALGQAVRGVLTDPPPRRATASLTVTPARVTTEVARGLGVKEVISSFTTRHPCCQPRVQNIHRIAEIVDGHVVLPGETFSLNGKVGRRDRARGFVPAPQILRGEFVDDVGGGVSQFATTLFNAVFFAGLEDVQHSAHSYYFSRYPLGREATVSFPEPDLRFRNDSPHGVLIRTSFTGTSITVTFWGTKRYEIDSITGPRTRPRPFETVYLDREDCSPSEGAEGFDVVVTRVFRQDGREVRREDFKTRYKPQPTFVCGPPPAPGR